MTGFPINPPNAPIADPSSGRITPEWYRFFRDIQKMIGSGASNPFEDTGFLSALPAQPVATSGDNLIPPSIPQISDDLMYPPRYGS